MLHTALRNDALTSSGDGFELRLGLPWIRSMPLSGVSALEVRIDGDADPIGRLEAVLGERRISAGDLHGEHGWWFVQDRLVLAVARRLDPGAHEVSVRFQLLVPYLQAGPGRPLVLPFRVDAKLELDAGSMPGAARDVA